jgi:RNA-directed DNA polymerase
VSSERRTDGCCGNDRGGACEETRDLAAGSPVVKRTMRARKAHSLIGQVYDRRNLRLAWERVKKNKGAGGVDGVTIARFDENLEHYLDVLHRQLKDGRYRPRPVKRVEIDKPGTTKKRPLGIPTVMDRVCQQALVHVLAPIFEPTFQEASFGYRPGRSTHKAMRRIWRQLGQAEWIVDGDISDFFGSLSHERLIDLVADRVADGKVLSLIRSMLTAGALVDGVFESAVAGTPQGGVASPLLSNIYLTVFDERMEQAGFALTRYADDWLIVCRSRSEAERALASARAVLEEELGLRLHSDKTRIVHVIRGSGRAGARCRRCRRSVSPARPPNPLRGIPRNGLYVRRMVMLKTRSEGGVCPARSDSGWGGVQHIQSASRNARSVSDGRYLPGLVPSGAVREIACSLSAGSACS